MGEFLPTVSLFTWGLFTLQKWPKFLGLLFRGYVCNYDINVFGYILGDFFANTSGVDVMITIFCDFYPFSAKKIAVFLKNQCYDQNFSKN
jgi:hypothetical protein